MKNKKITIKKLDCAHPVIFKEGWRYIVKELGYRNEYDPYSLYSCIVACDGRKHVGVFAYKEYDDMINASLVYIRQEYRRKGVFYLLLDEFMKVTQIRGKNTKYKRFYVKSANKPMIEALQKSKYPIFEASKIFESTLNLR